MCGMSRGSPQPEAHSYESARRGFDWRIGPQRVQLDFDGVERLDSHDIGAAVRAEEDPSSALRPRAHKFASSAIDRSDPRGTHRAPNSCWNDEARVAATRSIRRPESRRLYGPVPGRAPRMLRAAAWRWARSCVKLSMDDRARNLLDSIQRPTSSQSSHMWSSCTDKRRVPARGSVKAQEIAAATFVSGAQAGLVATAWRMRRVTSSSVG